MKSLWVILVGLLGFTSPKAAEQWMVSSESQITIHGSTNIGDYSCSLEKIYCDDTLQCNYVSNIIKFGPNKLALPVKEFDCNNYFVNNDFQELLKAKQYKNILVEMLEIENGETSSTGRMNGKIKVTIVGKERVYSIPFKPQYKDDRNFILSGKVSLPFSDFGLTPPSRFGGLVKIDDNIYVNFRLRIQKQFAYAQ